MSRVIQTWEMASPQGSDLPARGLARGIARLFSSALFCLWLSTASLMVWVDFATPPAQQVASNTQPAARTDAIKHH